MLTALFLIFYFIVLVLAYLSLSCIKSCGSEPMVQVAVIVGIIIAVLVIQAFLFGETYRSLYSHDQKSFSGADLYKARRQTDAVKSLWLSKDVRKDYYFPNWMLLELSDYLIDKSSLDVFYDAYKLHYSSRLTYADLRNKLSKEYPELLVRVIPKPLPPSMPPRVKLLDLPAVNEFIIRLAASVKKHSIHINIHDRQSPVSNNIAVSLLTLLNELTDEVTINRLDILLSAKSEEMLGLLDNSAKDERRGQIQTEIETTLFFYLAQRMLIKTSDLPVALKWSDFWFYSALSFFSANTGDIQPVSLLARLFTFLQIVGTFVVLALAVAFLSNAVNGIDRFSWPVLRGFIFPVSIASGAVVLLAMVWMLFQKCCFNRPCDDILKIPENYGYSAPRMDGTVDVMINVNSPEQSGHLTRHFNLSMPYQAVIGDKMRYPGILVKEGSTMIVWAEIFQPAIDRISIYGDGYDIGEIRAPYKLLIPASFRAFSNQ